MIRGHGSRDKDIFELPEIPPQDEEDIIISSDDDSDSETDMILEQVGLKNVHDVYQVDVDSEQFVNLPKNIQYEVLNELKGKKKQNSWAKMHEMPRKAEDFSGFQMERLKRRRKIDAKLDNVRDDLSKNQMEVIDSKLFVGDKMGLKKLKTETRRMASRPDAGVLFMSGLSQQNHESEEEEDPEPGTSVMRGPSKKLVKRKEVRDDNEHIDAAIALSLTADPGPTQEDIYNMIKKENTENKTTLAVDLEVEEDPDVIILIPPPSQFQSNRAGGLGLLKQEPPEEVKLEPEASDNEEVCVESVEEVSMMSDSDSDSSGGFVEVDDGGEQVDEKGEEEDLFADVFKEKDNITILDSIVKDSKIIKDQTHTKFADDPPKSNPDAEDLLERISHLDKPSDIFADIAARAKSKPRLGIGNGNVNSNISPKSSEKHSVSKSTFSREVSDNLKNGPGIMMKIASKWADAEAKDAESDESDIDNPRSVNDEEEEKDAFDLEQERLVKEMNEVQKENRLLRFTQGVNNDHELVTKSKDVPGDKVPSKLLSSNIRTEEKLKSTTSSLLEAGSFQEETSASDGKIYMAPAAGFVPAGRDMDPDKIVIQRDEDEEEWDPAAFSGPPPSQEEELQTQDLLRLQEQLAAEQNTLVAEMGKANRLSNSITDQMYADCQVYVSLSLYTKQFNLCN